MKANTNPMMDAVLDAHSDNPGEIATHPPAQAGRFVSKYNEEWEAFVTHHSNRKTVAPDGFDHCPRVWNLPYGQFQ